MMDYNDLIQGEKEGKGEVRERFSKWLYEQISSRGWSQREMARRAGVSQTQVPAPGHWPGFLFASRNSFKCQINILYLTI